MTHVVYPSILAPTSPEVSLRLADGWVEALLPETMLAAARAEHPSGLGPRPNLQVLVVRQLETWTLADEVAAHQEHATTLVGGALEPLDLGLPSLPKGWEGACHRLRHVEDDAGAVVQLHLVVRAPAGGFADIVRLIWSVGESDYDEVWRELVAMLATVRFAPGAGRDATHSVDEDLVTLSDEQLLTLLQEPVGDDETLTPALLRTMLAAGMLARDAEGGWAPTGAAARVLEMLTTGAAAMVVRSSVVPEATHALVRVTEDVVLVQVWTAPGINRFRLSALERAVDAVVAHTCAEDPVESVDRSPYDLDAVGLQQLFDDAEVWTHVDLVPAPVRQWLVNPVVVDDASLAYGRGAEGEGWTVTFEEEGRFRRTAGGRGEARSALAALLASLPHN